MADIVFIKKDGTEVTGQADVGERLLNVAYRLGLTPEEAGFGECGGGCVCGTCHVSVEEGLADFHPADPLEADMLDSFPVLTAASRLTCQLAVQPGQERIVLKVL